MSPNRVDSGEKKWHVMAPEEVFQALHASDEGLNPAEVLRRQETYGFNEIAEEKEIFIPALFFAQFKNALVLILILATVISAIIRNVVDAAVIFAAVLLVVTLGFFFEYRAEKAIKMLKTLAAPTAHVLRAGTEVKIPSIEVVPGDILLLQAGDRVAADARLFEVVNLTIDESPLTGESIPVKKEVSVLHEDVILAERKNMVYSGTTILQGRGKGVVIATGMRTEFGAIAKMLAEAKEEETPLKRRISEIGRWLSTAYLDLAIALVAVGVLKGADFLEMLIWSISLAVAIVPETLPLIITGTLALGVLRMARKQAIVRKLPAVETLGCITAICADKTGTLTKNEMTVRSIYVAGKMIAVTGTGYAPTGEFIGQRDGERLEPRTVEGLSLALQIAALCNDSSVQPVNGEYRVRGDPTEGALVVVARKAGLQLDELTRRYPRVAEIPFERERMRMTTLHQDTVQGRTMAFVKGAPEVLLSLSTGIAGENGGYAVVKELTEVARRAVLDANDKMAAEALRVIAVAYRGLPEGVAYTADRVENDLIFVGLFGMTDPPREEVKEAIERCKTAGIKPIMITGDNKLTALAIAAELGVITRPENDEKVLTGADLEKMSEEELEKRVDDVVVYSRVSPAHKLRIVESLQRRGNVVAMTGDGINDAPALKRSDVGIAMNSGTEVAKEASDMVLTDDNFATIVAAIHEGRAIYDNVKKYLLYILSYGVAEVFLLTSAIFSGLPFPLVAIQILWANIVIEDLPAMGLGIDPPDPDIMARKPRNPREKVFTPRILQLLILMAAVIGIGCLGIFLHYLSGSDGAEGMVKKAQSMVFATFILYEMINAFNCRSERYSLVRVGILSNKWLVGGVISSLLLMIFAIQLPFTGRFFHTVPLTRVDWGIALATSTTIFIAVEVWKACVTLFRLTKDKRVRILPP
ncbi:MAG: cation-translocating P-type ATPase [Methanophagales archaeon ANME-1-THS]|nr:MAG: cation-translocating P-type ATPase [Methanophagales archaeon ANME-1-THS]